MTNTNQFIELLEKVKTYKIDIKEKNYFDSALRKHYENPTTELLSFFLNISEAHNLNDLFFNGLIHCLANKINKDASTFGDFISVETEICTEDGKRIDLIIETTKNLLIFECKIFHIQNNPIDSYVTYAKKRVCKTPLKPLYFVLSISGISEFQQNSWNGISYQNLIQEITKLLPSHQIDMHNKWLILAHEFLDHLNNYYTKPLNMENFKLVKENAHEIQKLFEITQQVFSQINDAIVHNLQLNLQEKFSIRNYRPSFYNGNPEYWFCNNILKNSRWICPTLVIHTNKKNLPCDVHLCLEHKTEQDENFLNTFKSDFPSFKLENTVSMYSNIPYTRYTLKFDTLDVDQINLLILEINKLILQFYPLKYETPDHTY